MLSSEERRSVGGGDDTPAESLAADAGGSRSFNLRRTDASKDHFDPTQHGRASSIIQDELAQRVGHPLPRLFSSRCCQGGNTRHGNMPILEMQIRMYMTRNGNRLAHLPRSLSYRIAGRPNSFCPKIGTADIAVCIKASHSIHCIHCYCTSECANLGSVGRYGPQRIGGFLNRH